MTDGVDVSGYHCATHLGDKPDSCGGQPSSGWRGSHGSSGMTNIRPIMAPGTSLSDGQLVLLDPWDFRAAKKIT